ncbi:AI-2E family transporter [Paracoccus benzoatiresistens]|uniref:AI-2E family transporter n=1 Tax=Paracoccus benzoatiresistens TaxID=2997341 RepID=A0ABT4J125_9RHOB|nr:AI-2E family transporter [Paracoccus sp. EF6]MCZ0960116.1 AI-2E family transporter [Paracoccus sp. EF6]
MTERPSTPAPQPRLRPGPIAIAFATALALAAVWQWSNVLLMGFGAILIAIALRAGARAMHRYAGIGLKPGVLLSGLAAVLVVAGIVAWAGPSISGQFRQLIGSLPDAWKQIEDWLGQSSIGQFLERRIEDAQANGGGGEGGDLPTVFSYLTGTLTTVFGGVANLVLLITVAIFLALDAPMYRAGALRLVPPSYRARAGQIADELARALARWMGGQALDMAVVALVTGVGLWLLGVPLALVLGLIAGLTNIIPVVGPFMSGIPAVLFALTQGFDLAIYVALLFVLVQQAEGNLLMPLIQRYAADLPPALTVLAILAFGSLFGFAGIVLATPLLLVSIILVKRIYVEDVLDDWQGD